MCWDVLDGYGAMVISNIAIASIVIAAICLPMIL